MAVTDEAGIIYYRFIYDTYGELSDITTDDGISLKSSEQLTEYRLAELSNATGIDYLYNGQYGVETDRNGLYYMRARYYDQDIKRFINRDVVSGDIGNSQSLNRYCYVQGNPVSLTDPFGLCPDGNSGLIGYEKSPLWHLLQAISPSGFLNYFYSQIIAPKLHTGLDLAGILFDCSDAINGLIYFAEGNIYLGVEYTLRGLPFWGMVAIGCGAPLLGVALIIIGIGLNLAFGVEYLVDAVGTAYEDYQNGEFGLDNAAQLTLGVLSVVGGGYAATRSLRTAARGIAPSNTLGNGPQVNGKSGSNANKVYFGQKAVSPNFSSQGTFKGASIQSVADRLASGELSADNLPIEYIVRDGKMITMNNRSLTALSKANMKPTVLIDITGDAANEAKLTQRLSEMGGQPSESILIRKIGEIVHIPN